MLGSGVSATREQDLQTTVSGGVPQPSPDQRLIGAVATPYGRLAQVLQGAVQAAPRTAAAVAGGAAMTAPTAAEPPGQADVQGSLQQLLSQRATLQRQTGEARARREAERRSGEGPRYQAADTEFRQLNDQLSGLDALIRDKQKRNSPEFRLEIDRKRADEVARQREEWANTSWSKAYPWLPAAAAAVGIGAGASGANAISQAGVRSYNERITDLSTRWGDAVERARRARTPQGREQATIEAQGPGQ